MSRTCCWTLRLTSAAGVAAAALAAAGVGACADRAAPVLAPRGPVRIANCEGQLVRDSLCAGPCTPATCGCDSGGSDSSCAVPVPPVVPMPDTAAPRVRITAAGGPNGGGSFTTRSGERTLALAADVRPTFLAPGVAWRVVDDPTSGVADAAPPASPANGTSATVDVPAQTTARWRLRHGTPWTEKALAFKVTAEAPNFYGPEPLRDSAIVRQREVDVLRQEYVDFGLPVPGAADVRTAADVAGLTRFGWPQLNQGDYSLAVLTPVLLAKLGEVERSAGRSLVLTSVFRNPAHHRFHVTVSGGARVALLSQHQYGTAVDIATQNDRAIWARLRNAVKAVGACAEPLEVSTVNHVHADWRAGSPTCPKGW